MDPKLLASHVEWVGKTHSVKVVYDQKDASDSFACKGTPLVIMGMSFGFSGDDLQVHIAPVIDVKTYVIAMHELGHTIAKDGMLNREENISNMILAERAAWAWAEANVIFWNQEMADERAEVMGTPYRSQYSTGEFKPTYERHHANLLVQEAAKVADRVRPRSQATVAGIVANHKALANNGRCPHCAQANGCHHPSCKVSR